VPVDLKPSLETAQSDVADVYASGCHQSFDAVDAAGCLIGGGDGPLIALFGDSHAAQWVPALTEGGFRIHAYTKSACPAIDVPTAHPDGPYPECAQWRDAVMDRIGDDRPAIIIVANWSGYSTAAVDPRTWGPGLQTTIRELSTIATVAVIDDTPQLQTKPAECLSAHLDDVAACETPPAIALSSVLRAAEAEALTTLPAARWSMNDSICSPDRCPLIVGGVLRYRDADHLTATFSRLLAPRVAELVNDELHGTG